MIEVHLEAHGIDRRRSGCWRTGRAILEQFVKVMPTDYKRVLEERQRAVRGSCRSRSWSRSWRERERAPRDRPRGPSDRRTSRMGKPTGFKEYER